MVDGINKTGPVEGQKFSKNGVKLSEFKGNAPLFNYFKSKGLDENSIVYESDVQNLLKDYDKNKDGEFSRKEMKGLGIEGKRKELKAAATMLNKIAATPLAEQGEDGLYPVKTNDNETSYYDKNGVIAAKHTKGENGVARYEKYQNGNTELITHLEENDGKNIKVTDTEYEEHGLPAKRLIATNDGKVLERREFDYDGPNLHHTVDKIGGEEITTFYDNK